MSIATTSNRSLKCYAQVYLHGLVTAVTIARITILRHRFGEKRFRFVGSWVGGEIVSSRSPYDFRGRA
jgi:hypothetical protein